MRVIGTAYHQYLNSSEWRKKREERLHHDAYQCTRCNAKGRLEVHHVTYERLGNETIEDLETLCGDCHKREHGRDPDLPGVVPDRWVEDRLKERWAMEREQEEIAIAFGVLSYEDAA